MHESLPPENIVSPQEALDIVANRLIPAWELNSKHRNTFKFFVEGRDDLFCRLNIGESVEAVNGALEAVSRLGNQGVTALPAQLVAYEDEPYVLTYRVSGRTLREEVASGAPEFSSEDLDLTLASVGRNIIHCYENGQEVAPDVSSPLQYMWGTIAVDSEPKIWLVDLPQYALSVDTQNYYTQEVLNHTAGLIEAERLVNQRLPEARSVVMEALSLSTENEDWTNIMRNAVRYSLRYSRIIYSTDEEVIQQLPRGE